MKRSQIFLSPFLAISSLFFSGWGSMYAADAADSNVALFSEFNYSVTSPTERGKDEYGTPLLPGCYPDPSIVRVGDDYFMVNSSFAFYPGVPIWHSTDMQSWERLGYVLNRPGQLDLPDGLRISGGIYAPDISYNPHNGLYYMVTTLVDNGGNFYVTTADPMKGDWSDPVWLPEVGGIDPSFLFDSDGKAYIVNNDSPDGPPLYDGHRAIHIHDFDWKSGKVTGEPVIIVNGGVDISEKPVWIEGPHLYHIGEKYFLMCAEGGTGPDHREVIFESNSPKGPFKPCRINPILTQKDLNPLRQNAVTCAGHADLVEDVNGNWWAVFLAVRPYGTEGHDIMGRETFIHPVEWVDGQPVITAPHEVLVPHAQPESHSELWNAQGLAKDAFFIRNPQSDSFKVDSSGRLRLKASDVKVTDHKSASAIGRWATENAFTVTATLDEFTPVYGEDIAGILLYQDDGCNIVLGKSLDPEGHDCVKLTAISKGVLTHMASLRLKSTLTPVKLKVEADGKGHYIFSAAEGDGPYRLIGIPIPASNISTSTAGNFTGTMVGVYATAKK